MEDFSNILGRSLLWPSQNSPTVTLVGGKGESSVHRWLPSGHVCFCVFVAGHRHCTAGSTSERGMFHFSLGLCRQCCLSHIQTHTDKKPLAFHSLLRAWLTFSNASAYMFLCSFPPNRICRHSGIHYQQHKRLQWIPSVCLCDSSGAFPPKSSSVPLEPTVNTLSVKWLPCWHCLTHARTHTQPAEVLETLLCPINLYLADEQPLSHSCGPWPHTHTHTHVHMHVKSLAGCCQSSATIVIEEK